jgi:hypothetical protein
MGAGHMFIDHKALYSRIPKNSKIVLDVGGCGDQLETLHPSVTHIIDIVPPNAEIKEKRPNLIFIIGDAGNDSTWESFLENEIDFIICSHTIEDSSDPTPIIRNISKYGKRGYFEFPSVIQEVLPDNSPYGLAHHSWFIRAIPKEEALTYRWTAPIKGKGDPFEKDVPPFIIGYMPKVIAYADKIRKTKYKVPFRKRWLRRHFYKRPYKFVDSTKSWTGLFWSNKCIGAYIHTEGYEKFQQTLQKWCNILKTDPEYFEY